MAPSNSDVPSLPVDTEATARLKAARRTKRRGRFVKGPLPFAWIVAAQACHPKGLAVALAIRMAVDRAGGRAVPLPAALLRELGVERETRRRALAALERAGLVRAERARGRLPRVALVDAIGDGYTD